MSDGFFDDTKHSREHELSNAIIGAAIDAHKVLGPGLLRSACHELTPNMNTDMRPRPSLRILNSLPRLLRALADFARVLHTTLGKRVKKSLTRRGQTAKPHTPANLRQSCCRHAQRGSKTPYDYHRNRQ